MKKLKDEEKWLDWVNGNLFGNWLLDGEYLDNIHIGEVEVKYETNDGYVVRINGESGLLEYM